MPNPIQLQRVIYPGGAGGGGVAFVGALDGFTTSLMECWSHRRKLVTNPVSETLLQARRSSDEEPLNVGALANGELDQASLLAFTGVGNYAGVAALMGQVNGRDLIQEISEEQRLIVDVGSLVTVGGKAASRGLRAPVGEVTGGGLITNTFTTYTGNVLSVFLRGEHSAYSGWFTAIVDAYFGLAKNSSIADSSARPILFHRNVTGAPGLTQASDFSGTFNSDYLISLIFDGTNVTFRDGTNTYTQAFSASFDFNRFTFGLLNDIAATGFSSDANRFQEAAVWSSDQTANEAAIRSALLA
jgi:hypothetical protein